MEYRYNKSNNDKTLKSYLLEFIKCNAINTDQKLIEPKEIKSDFGFDANYHNSAFAKVKKLDDSNLISVSQANLKEESSDMTDENLIELSPKRIPVTKKKIKKSPKSLTEEKMDFENKKKRNRRPPNHLEQEGSNSVQRINLQNLDKTKSGFSLSEEKPITENQYFRTILPQNFQFNVTTTDQSTNNYQTNSAQNRMETRSSSLNTPCKIYYKEEV